MKKDRVRMRNGRIFRKFSKRHRRRPSAPPLDAGEEYMLQASIRVPVAPVEKRT